MFSELIVIVGLIASAIAIIEFFFKPLTKFYKYLRILWCKYQNGKGILNENQALQISHSVLGGSVKLAKPFRNIDSKDINIAVLHRGSEVEHEYSVSLLREFGPTYIKIWSVELFRAPDFFDVEDLGTDGFNEIIFEEQSFGTAMGSNYFMIYSTKRKELYQVSESFNWSDATAPSSPEVVFNPKAEETFQRTVATYLHKKGLLNPFEKIDFDNPKFAVQRWHRDNGTKTSGEIALHFFEGAPIYGSSLNVSLNTNTIQWLAYFKGPLFGYIKSENQHFIAYSPSCNYDWVTCIAYDGRLIWFGIHNSGLFSFEYIGKNGDLRYYSEYKGKKLPEVVSLVYQNGKLFINEKLTIPTNELISKTL